MVAVATLSVPSSRGVNNGKTGVCRVAQVVTNHPRGRIGVGFCLVTNTKLIWWPSVLGALSFLTVTSKQPGYTIQLINFMVKLALVRSTCCQGYFCLLRWAQGEQFWETAGCQWYSHSPPSHPSPSWRGECRERVSTRAFGIWSAFGSGCSALRAAKWSTESLAALPPYKTRPRCDETLYVIIFSRKKSKYSNFACGSCAQGRGQGASRGEWISRNMKFPG